MADIDSVAALGTNTPALPLIKAACDKRQEQFAYIKK